MTLLTNILVDAKVLIRNCDWCGQGFYQGRDNHRFCRRKCGVEFYMAERRAALALFRSLRGQEQEDQEDERRTATDVG
jgi:hypothetical protein